MNCIQCSFLRCNVTVILQNSAMTVFVIACFVLFVDSGTQPTKLYLATNTPASLKEHCHSIRPVRFNSCSVSTVCKQSITTIWRTTKLQMVELFLIFLVVRSSQGFVMHRRSCIGVKQCIELNFRRITLSKKLFYKIQDKSTSFTPK